MPKNRRRKNQRVQDNKSRLNSQNKQKQQRDQEAKEKEPDINEDEVSGRTEEDDVELVEDVSSEAVYQSDHRECQEEEVFVESSTLSTTNSAAYHAAGSLPNHGDTLCSQHKTPTTIIDTEVAIENSDRSITRGLEAVILDSSVPSLSQIPPSVPNSTSKTKKCDLVSLSFRHISPDRHIVSNENATNCDITTDTTTTSDSSKARLEDCDNNENELVLIEASSNLVETNDNILKEDDGAHELCKRNPDNVISTSNANKFESPKPDSVLSPSETLELTDNYGNFSSRIVPPIRHPIVQEVVTILYPSRVESPKPMSTKRSAGGPLMKSKSLDDDDIMIQEMSDGSSTGDVTDNQPLISEASESGTDTDTGPPDYEETIDPRILSVQTLPLLESPIQSSPMESKPPAEGGFPDELNCGEILQDTKARRARNRAALEMHFLPQFLNPRYLDSIKEENSDTSDLESKSPVRERSTSMCDLEDDVFLEASKERRASAPISTTKANTVFPKSSLDFSQKHKHLSNLRYPQTTIIREESPCYAVETKLIDPPEAVEERCSEWTTKRIEQSTDAVEVVYIDSASSSSSSLNELDYTDSTITNGSHEDDDSSETVHIETPTIECFEDTANIFGDLEKTPTREMPTITPNLSQQVTIDDTLSDTWETNQEAKRKSGSQDDHNAHYDIHQQPQCFQYSNTEQHANNNTAISNEIIATTDDISQCHNESSRHRVDFSVTTHTQLNLKSRSFDANAGQSAVERETLEDISSSDYKQEPLIQPDFEIGGPCSNNMFAALLSPLIGDRNNTCEEPPTPVTPVLTTDALNKTVNEDNSANRGELVRQDSAGSHCSAQSQNTVINRGTPTQNVLADFDSGPYVSGSSTEFIETEYTYRTIVSFSPKDLRQLCLEKLACMPYGKVILEELASVSEALNDLTEKHQQNQILNIQNLKSIKNMPYPRPELPNISDLIVPKRPEDPIHVKLMMAPPSKQPSPPPPPVPMRPSLEDTWLGIPTDQHPNVLVCLSPAQRDYINSSSKQTQKSRPDPTPDTLLDMHQKFVKRRGYHELASDVVEKIDRAKSTAKKLDQIVSSPQLYKNPSPPPVPPPPVYEPQFQHLDEIQTAGMTSKKSAVTVKAPNGSFNGVGDRVITFDDSDDKNNHRLLAIIRNSQQPFNSVKQTSREKVDRYVNSTTSTENFRYEEKLGQAVTPSNERLPPEVPPRFSTSDIRSHGTPNCAPLADPQTPSEMSSTTSTSFSDTPWSDYHHNFASPDFPKRFSNIEQKTTPFCSQILQTQPKRYSNIETTTTTSKKRIENGNVVYDISDTQKEKFTTGDDSLAGKTTAFTSPVSACNDKKTVQTERKNTETIHEKVHQQDTSSSSATKTFNQLFENRMKTDDLHKPATTRLQEEKKQDNFAYDEFRQRAKESAAERAKSEFLERQNFLLKDFDELTKLIKDDLFLDDSKNTEDRTFETTEKSKFSQSNESRIVDDKEKVKPEGKKPQTYNIPIQLESNQSLLEKQTIGEASSKTQTVHTERTIPIRIEKSLSKENPNLSYSMGSLPTASVNLKQRERHLSERRLSSQNLDEWMRYIDHLGASSENITKPLQKEVELCAFGRHPTIRAPRLTSTDSKQQFTSRLCQSTSNLSTIGTEQDHLHTSHHFNKTNSLIDTSPITPYVTPRRRSLPREINDAQMAYIRQKESEIRTEFDQLEQDRRRLIEEMEQVHHKNRLRKDMHFHQSCRLPTLSEEEAFRQQMHDEWLDKVAEREERRMHKIVKISSTSDELAAPQVPSRNASIKKAASTTNISDEFLRRVKERRSKLCMPSDSDWESGAESQPQPRNRKDNTPPQVKVFEGQSERDFKNLPPHLREFAEITNQIVREQSYSEADRNANTGNQNESSNKKEESKGAHHIAAQILKSSSETSNNGKPIETRPILRTTRETTDVYNKLLMTRKKETRFKLTPNRRSWSESDLLREIDNALTLSKGFLFGAGVWSPSPVEGSTSKTNHQGPTPPPPPPPPPIWSPKASPTPARKEFRPVKFESPVLPRKFTGQRQDSTPVTPPWASGNSAPLIGTHSSSCSNLTKNSYADAKRQEQQTYQSNLRKSGSVGNNLAQRPTGASYIVTNRPQIPKDQKPAFVKPNEIIYQLKNEYMSEPESENDRPKKMAQLARRQFDGIGPMTKDGMPIVLRSEVKENNQHQWYKKMYNTLHKTKPDDEYVTIRYKTHRGRIPFKSSGYMSEPEPNYDSDYSVMRYHTLDRRRVPSTGSYQEERNYGTMPNPVRPSQGSSYRNQPGKIENYIPGHSSVSEKEKKEWWDEVMDIFNGNLEQQKLSSNYTEGNLSRALKEGGYESDSNLIFRKRENVQAAPLSPIEQKQAYRSVQAGGEPPLQGFRKQAPEKPKDDDKEIEYFPITSTLTKIRVHTNSENQKPLATIQPPKEVVCYPITNVSRPLDLFAPFPKNVPSFIPVSSSPPPPPCRNSSRSTALKIVSSHYSKTSAEPTAADSRHRSCLQSEYYQHDSPNSKYGTITIRKQTKHQHQPVVRSKSVGTVTTASRLSSLVKEERRTDSNVRLSRKQLVRVRSISPTRQPSFRLVDLRKSSPSPVAFGRSVSKERMFAEEKKRLERALPSKSFTASTNILKDPTLKSAEEVKRAVRSSYSLARSGQASSNLSIFGTITKKNVVPGRNEQQTSQISINSVYCSKKPVSKSVQNMSALKRSPLKSKTSSTLSLARTNSTFSLDSTGSRKKVAKKPMTVMRLVPRNTSPPRTISSKPKRKSPPKEISATSKLHKRHGGEIQKKINNSIVAHHETVRSDKFFQNLFLQSSAIATQHEEEITEYPSNSVIDKARFFNSISARSEPSLRKTNVYLFEKKPVSDSKFLTKVTRHVHKSRSLSPSYRKKQYASHILHDTCNYFSSIDQLSEGESEFGDTKPGKMEELIYKYEQRSTSEPRIRKISTFPVVIHRHKTSEYLRSLSPETHEIKSVIRNVRSPSRRRIDSFRGSQREEIRKIVRASSVGSADDRQRNRIHTTSELSHSTGSLNVIEGHSSICPHRTSPRFKELNRFYRTLERVGQLEKATSSTDLHPIRKEGELIDFDVWKKVRAHERAEKELNHLVGKLKQDQRERDLFFRPKDVTDVKWKERYDSGLRCKEKSVEDIRDAFERRQEDESEDLHEFKMSASQDIYRPHWRGKSVVDVATNMVAKYNTQRKTSTRLGTELRPFLSNNLISTLSSDQVSKIKNQLNEIYRNTPGTSAKAKDKSKENFIITVDEPARCKVESLKVRCNSTISKEELLGAKLRRSESQTRSVERKVSPLRLSRDTSTKSCSELSEVEKKRLSFTISRELQEKVVESLNRNLSPSLLARETRGAIAAENAKKTLPDSSVQKDFVAIEELCGKTERRTMSGESFSEERKRVRKISRGESESNTSDISKATVIYRAKPPNDGVLNTIKYFEEKKTEEPPKTIYHAREYSSPDEEEVLKEIQAKFEAREKSDKDRGVLLKHTELCSSASDFRELFGERRTNFHVPPPAPPPPPDNPPESQFRCPSSLSNESSSYQTLFRSRSASPAYRSFYKCHLNMVQTGDVRKMTNKFENLNTPPRSNFFELGPPRRIRSNPELNRLVDKEGKMNPFKVTIRDHETGDVSWITHKFELKNNATRGRSRVRKSYSPILRNPLRKENRLMPHIDIISKTASLKQEVTKGKNVSKINAIASHQTQYGEVERIRSKFEAQESASFLGQMYTSSPDITELRDISSYLNANWVAHKYPRKRDNARSPIFPELGPESVEIKRRNAITPLRPSSTSPPRSKSLVTSILKPYYDVFADQKFDPSIHRPISRYVPDTDRTADSTGSDVWNKISRVPSTVKFKESDVSIPPPPPPLPMKNYTLNSNSFEANYREESPRRYVEGDVNIHYKTPIRYEYKDAIPDEELSRKQAESMQKLYQEERRRKYLQELEDMNNRRHTDNFIPSQKSPIALNRYDDFPTDVSPKSPSNLLNTVARALYNFQGQTARELSFKKGDVIYIRRQIDKNWYEGEHNAMIGLLPVNYVEIITKDGNKSIPQRKPSEGQARAKYSFQAQSAIELSLNKGELVTLTRRVDGNWFEGKIANRKGIFPVSYVDVLTDIGADDAIYASTALTNSATSKPVGTTTRTIITTTTNKTSPSLDELRTSLNNEFNHLTNGGQHPNGILRETKTTQKTEVLHVDTNSEPIAYRALYKYVPQNNDELELFEGDVVYVLEKCDDGWYVGTSERSGQFGTFPGNYVERA